MKLTAEQHQKNLEHLATLTPEMMEGMTVNYLRQLLSGINIANIQRGDVLINTTRARKSELIEAIYQMTSKPRVLVQMELTELSPEDVRLGLEGLMSDTSFSVAAYANQLFTDLRTYTMGQWDAEHGRWKMDTQYPQELSLQLFVRLEAYRTNDGVELMGDTKVSYASRIRMTVKRMIDETESNEVYYPQLCSAYDQLRLHNVKLLSDLTTEQREGLKTDAKTRQGNNQCIDPANLLAKAAHVLASVTRGESPRWQDVSIALVLCTGRRPSEIHATAEFKVTDEYGLEFTGQLKKKGNDTEAYTIPTLVPALDCLNGLEYLKTKGRYYYGDQHKAHRSVSTDIAKGGIKTWFDKYLPNVEDYTDERGKTFKVRTHYRMREIYALVSLERYVASTDKHLSVSDKTRYLSSILGHDDNSKAYENYDANFYIG